MLRNTLYAHSEKFQFCSSLQAKGLAKNRERLWPEPMQKKSGAHHIVTLDVMTRTLSKFKRILLSYDESSLLCTSKNQEG
jgi:hypothetical protein